MALQGKITAKEIEKKREYLSSLIEIRGLKQKKVAEEADMSDGQLYNFLGGVWTPREFMVYYDKVNKAIKSLSKKQVKTEETA